MISWKWIAVMAVVSLAAACGTDANTNTGGGGAVVDAGGSGSDGGGATVKGDNTKNKADLKVTDDKSVSVDIKAEKAAVQGDATSKAWGASNADEMLNLFMTEVKGSNSTVITVFVNTKKYPLPATDIPLGEPDSDAWVTYVAAGTVTGSFASKDKGTIDIAPCPENGKALVGKLKGAVLYSDLPTGPKTQTLDGTFNLVFWTGSGSLKCAETKPPVTGGEKSKVDNFTPPAGSTCDANPCNGGADGTSNCCPYGKCISDCAVKCTSDVATCIQECVAKNPMDGTCPTGCATKVQACNDACPDTCGATPQCKTAMVAVNACWAANASKCNGLSDEEDQDVCYADACCSEIKAAF